MRFVKSEMQRLREVMAKDGYEVVRIHYGYYSEPAYSGHGVGVPLVRHNGWEELCVSFIDQREDEPEYRLIYIQSWLLAYNLSMWEALGFRNQDMAIIEEWTKDNPAPDKSETTALYNLKVSV